MNVVKRISFDDLKKMIADVYGEIDAVYLHWTAGRYHQTFSDYHILIDSDGSLFVPADDLTLYRPHTWKRNSRAVGVAICACYGAIAKNGFNADLGDFPPTPEQIEMLALITAAFVKYGGVDMDNILTHCEAAYEDGYGPFSGDPDVRWDLWFVKDFDGQFRHGGGVIRGKARYYLQTGGV